jgi:hypothetical protein
MRIDRVVWYRLALILVLVSASKEVWADAFGIANVTFQWTDRAGGVHPLRSTWTTGVEVDTFVDDAAGTGFTAASGIGVFSGSDIAPFDSTTEFRGTVQSYLGDLSSAYAQINTAGGSIYSKTWPATGTFDVSDPPQNGSFTFTVDNTDFAGSALGIMQAVKHMADYYSGKGLSFPYLKINYDSTTTNGSFYQPATDTITLNPSDWASWDVVMHEVGHHIADNNSLAGVFGGPHNFGSQNINKADPAPGSRLAYGEGVGTFLGLMAVKDGNLNASIPGLPAKDINADYDAFNTPANASSQNDVNNVVFRISAESNGIQTGAAGGPKGEGDEMSVLRVLWDVYDSNGDAYAVGSDHANWGSTATLALMQNATTFKDFWDHLAASGIADPTKLGLAAAAPKFEVLGTLGETLQEYNFSGVPLTTGNVVSRPLLEFNEGNGDRSHKLRVVILNAAKDTIVDSFVGDDTAGLSLWSWRPDQPLAPGDYYWAALNSPSILNGAPATDQGWYWSSLKSIHVVPEASTLLLGSIGSMVFLVGWARRRS